MEVGRTSMNSSQNIEEIIKDHKDLPTLPGIAMRILDAVGKDQTNLKEIADIISTDPPLSAKVTSLSWQVEWHTKEQGQFENL